MSEADDLRTRLVQTLLERGAIRMLVVATAFSRVPREVFIPQVAAEQGLEAVYADEAHVTKRDASGMPLSSSSQPSLMAAMLELLDLGSGHRVLEIGSGTGYNAALMASIVGPTGHVTTIDVDPLLAEGAGRALDEAGLQADVTVGDGRRGFSADAPYDRIIVTAAADAISPDWLEQLAEGGRLVVPLRLDPDADALHLIPAFVREGDSLRSLESTWGGFMPLHGGEGGWPRPRASLQASLHAQQRNELLVMVTGSGLERLSRRGGERILAALLGEGVSVRRQGTTSRVGGHAPAVLVYLMVRIPPNRRVWIRHGGRHGVALIDPRATGIAAVTTQSLWTRADPTRPARWRLEAWGGESAGNELQRLVSDWQELQRTGRDQLEIIARPAMQELRLEFNWIRRPPRRGSARTPASA